jgi:hypothetical protein
LSAFQGQPVPLPVCGQEGQWVSKPTFAFFGSAGLAMDAVRRGSKFVAQCGKTGKLSNSESNRGEEWQKCACIVAVTILPLAVIFLWIS